MKTNSYFGLCMGLCLGTVLGLILVMFSEIFGTPRSCPQQYAILINNTSNNQDALI